MPSNIKGIVLTGFLIFVIALILNAQDTIFIRNNIRYIASELKIGNKAIAFKEDRHETSDFIYLDIKFVDSIVYSNGKVNYLTRSNPRYYRPLGIHGGAIIVPMADWITYTVGVDYFLNQKFALRLEVGKTSEQEPYFSTGFRVHTSTARSQYRFSGLIGMQLLRFGNEGGIFFPAGVNYLSKKGLMGEVVLMVSLPFISGMLVPPINFKLGYNIRSNKKCIPSRSKSD